MLRDLRNNVGAEVLLAPAVQSATVNSADADVAGFNSLTFLIITGAIVSSGNFTASIEDTDDEGASPDDHAAVTPEYLTGTLPTALAGNTVYRIGYHGHKRFARVRLVKNSGTSIACGVVAIQGHPNSAPVA